MQHQIRYTFTLIQHLRGSWYFGGVAVPPELRSREWPNEAAALHDAFMAGVLPKLAALIDREPIYAVDAELPPGALGWTLVRRYKGGVSAKHADGDLPRVQASRRELQRKIATFKTHADVDAALQTLVPFVGTGRGDARSVLLFGKHTLGDKKLHYELLRHAQQWPRRLESGPALAKLTAINGASGASENGG